MTVNPRNIVELIEAAFAADYMRVRRLTNVIAKELSKSGEKEVAMELLSLSRKQGTPLRTSGYFETVPVDSKSRLPLVEEQSWPEVPIFMSEEANRAFRDFLMDAKNVENMSAKGLASRLCLLLSGPPGTGKTLLASHVAAHLLQPLYVLRLDSVISSLLGDTAKNIRAVFDFVSKKNGVLFLDEMDAVAKLRDDHYELGELKRVVNSVIQGLDSLNFRSIVIAATNHPHLLDVAIWRRFPYKIDLSCPDTSVRKDLWNHFLFENQKESKLLDIIVSLSEGLSGADIEAIGVTARRHALLDSRPIDITLVATAILNSTKNKLTLPQREPLNARQKKQTAQKLKFQNDFSGANIGRLLGITRQAVYRYLKQDSGVAHD